MNRCNYCSLNDIILFAKQNGREVYVVPVDERRELRQTFPEAVEVYTTPSNHLDLAWIATMMELSDHCVC